MNELKHVGIIMDGNGRWATERGLKRTAGHKEGYETLKKLAKYILSSGVEYLSVFAFSTENFKRSEEEVDFLMNLFLKGFKSSIKEFNENNIKVVFSGRKEPLKDEVYESMLTLARETHSNTGGVLNICLNYGGQSEIVDVVKKINKDLLNNKISLDNVNENTIYKYLYNELPPIDLLIRTSGEERISNFMLYSLAYSELYFPKTYFPDFDEKEYDKAVEIYNNRDRRFGSIKKE